jgi:ABC-type nitrate/sulfonate/bicarbonate transport system substrate-binding protein
MRRFLVVVFLLLIPLSSFSAVQERTVRLITRALGDSTVIYEIGKRLGFYAEEGLRVELILTRVSTGIQAILGGSADYINHGSVIPAILRGVPIRVLMVDSDKPTSYLVTNPKISSFTDLIGKTIAIQDFAGADALMVRDTLVANGVPLDRVSLRTLGPPPYRLQALLGGTVDAAPLNFLLSHQAQKSGFKILAYTGDFTSDIQVTAAGPLRAIVGSQSDVYRFVKATLKAQLYFFQNPNDEAFRIYSEVNKLADPVLARDAYEARLRRSSDLVRVGRVSQKALVQAVERIKEQLRLAGTPLKQEVTVSADDLADFSFVQRAYDEVQASGWEVKKYEYRPIKR